METQLWRTILHKTSRHILCFDGLQRKHFWIPCSVVCYNKHKSVTCATSFKRSNNIHSQSFKESACDWKWLETTRHGPYAETFWHSGQLLQYCVTSAFKPGQWKCLLILHFPRWPAQGIEWPRTRITLRTHCGTTSYPLLKKISFFCDVTVNLILYILWLCPFQVRDKTSILLL